MNAISSDAVRKLLSEARAKLADLKQESAACTRQAAHGDEDATQRQHALFLEVPGTERHIEQLERDLAEVEQTEAKQAAERRHLARRAGVTTAIGQQLDDVLKSAAAADGAALALQATLDEFAERAALFKQTLSSHGFYDHKSQQKRRLPFDFEQRLVANLDLAMGHHFAGLQRRPWLRFLDLSPEYMRFKLTAEQSVGMVIDRIRAAVRTHLPEFPILPEGKQKRETRKV
ncbi:MAG: hypothetical protein P8Y71_27660 [Pseudolabrys sp.]